MKQPNRIGILIGSKNLSTSELQLLGAGRLMDREELPIKFLGKKKLKKRAEIADEGMEFVTIGKIIKRKDFNSALKLSNLLKSEDISVVLYRNPGDSALLVTTKFLMKGRLRLIFIQDRPIAEMSTDFLHTFQFNQIDAWITPLMQTAKNVKTSTNLDHSKVHVFSLPIARKPYISIENSIESNPSKENKTLGWFLPKRNDIKRRTALRIANILSEETRFTLLVNTQTRKSDLREELPELLPFKDRIHLTAYPIDNPDYYANLNACFVDSESEPFSGISVRLLFSGVLPLVGKNLLSDELFENGKLCTYLLSDRKGQASEIYEKLDYPKFRQTLRAEALHTIGKRYSKKRFNQNIHALIEALPKKSRFR